MTLWDAFQRRRPEIASAAGYALSTVLYNEAVRTQSYSRSGMSEIAADIAADPATVVAGVYGYGAWVLDSEEVVPALFVLPGMAEPGGARLSESELAGLVPAFLRTELADVQAIPLTQPSAFAASLCPGAALTVGSRSATAGIWVRCRTSNVTGFVTAGHAAPTSQVIVRDGAGTAVGTVLRSLHRGLGINIAATADVALVEAKFGVTCSQSPLPIASVAPKDQVALQVPRGALSSWIRGLSPSFSVSPTDAPWGEVGITASAISVPGDSGGPVTANGHIVAHLVGGARTDYSVVQDVEYQLKEIDVDPI